MKGLFRNSFMTSRIFYKLLLNQRQDSKNNPNPGFDRYKTPLGLCGFMLDSIGNR